MDIYWSPMPSAVVSPMRVKEPDLALRHFPKSVTDDNVNKCPAMAEYHNNLFALKFPISYGIDVFSDGDVASEFYTQQVFQNLVRIRDKSKRLYSLNFNTVFVAERPCEIEITSAHTIRNSFTKNTFLVPGKYDIGKWIRPLECAFFADAECDKIHIQAGDVWAFMRIRTDEKVNFKRFFLDQKLLDMMSMFSSGVFPRTTFKNMSYYYNMLLQTGYKSRFMKSVKKNI